MQAAHRDGAEVVQHERPAPDGQAGAVRGLRGVAPAAGGVRAAAAGHSAGATSEEGRGGRGLARVCPAGTRVVAPCDGEHGRRRVEVADEGHGAAPEPVAGLPHRVRPLPPRRVRGRVARLQGDAAQHRGFLRRRRHATPSHEQTRRQGLRRRPAGDGERVARLVVATRRPPGVHVALQGDAAGARGHDHHGLLAPALPVGGPLRQG
mmetsp:Transcript_81746/g.229287  ORF Transcript_81746/g.229287 Transcript_81746/m.229287 type:complete len:207 (+) Transcript_81746:359-979(+)